MDPKIVRLLIIVPIFIVSLCIHEFAHGWIAHLRGDDTAKKRGRLTLNPVAHADLFGTVLLPLFCLYYNLFFVGWAKPVPVDPRKMKYGIKDMALVAAAGPFSNVLLALLSTGILALSVHLPMAIETARTIQTVSVTSIQINLMLAIFNLIPCPPLDGFRIFQVLIPSGLLYRFQRLEGAIGIVFLLSLYLVPGALKILALPVQYCFRALVSLV